MTLNIRIAIFLGLAAMVTTTPVRAQIGGLPTSGLPGLPSAVTGQLPAVGSATRAAAALADRALQAPTRLSGLIRRSNGALQADPLGWPVVADEVVAVDLPDEARVRALEAGFTMIRQDTLDGLGLTATVLAPPRRTSLARAIDKLRELAPETEITFNHVLAPAGSVGGARFGGDAAAGPPVGDARLGLIDTGVEATHPALASSAITQRGFAGPPRMGAHGLAVASLMVGQSGAFTGGDPGASLLVADIYGGQPTGGSSTGLAQALSWMVEQRVTVVNISLVGPRNALVQRAVAAAQTRGVTVVAAVGNDGPAAPPLYPAAYDGVVGVTAVGARDQALPEAARGLQVDFAAPGADMAAAAQAGRWTTVRGASFASPIVAGLLARNDGGPRALAALERQASDLGAPGLDPVYGHGLVGTGSRVAPRVMGATGRLAP